MWLAERIYVVNRLSMQRVLDDVDEQWQPRSELTKNDEVYLRLRDEILWNVIPGDTIITESDLADRFCTSRSPVRYALARAHEAGLVAVRPRQGYLVKAIRLEDAQEILYMRFLLEVSAAERASTLVSDPEIENLMSLAQLDCLVDGQVDGRRLAASNREFHMAIVRAARNSRLERGVSALLDEMLRILVSVTEPVQVEEMGRRHLRIAEALASHRPEVAREAMMVELDASRERIASSLGTHGTAGTRHY